jgi:hypothetical protein
MKTIYWCVTSIIFATIILTTSCKKDKEKLDEGAINLATDEAAIDEESHQLVDDGSTAMECNNISNARIGKLFRICGADSAIVADDYKSAKIYYNNSVSCDGNRKRTGILDIVLSKGNAWKDQGSEITISTQNITITRLKDLKVVSIKGTHIVKNLNGGTLVDVLLSNQTLKHEITAVGMQVSLENGSQVRTWNAHRYHTIYKNSNGLEIKIEGADPNGVALNGTSAKGDNFVTTITQALILNSCNGTSTDAKWNVLDGIKSHTVNGKKIDVGYGYNTSQSKIGNCDANTIKINYEGDKMTLEKYYTYK